MAVRPSYTLAYAIVREVKNTAGEIIREDEIRPAGHTFELRRPRGVNVLEVVDVKGEVNQAFYMISEATRLSREEVACMDTWDIKQIGEIIGNFTEVGPQT